MKEYPLTGPEMWQLAGVGFASTVFFAAASFFLSSWFDIYKDLSAPPDEMTEAVRGYWSAMRDTAFWAAIGSAIIGLLLTGLNGMTIFNIIRNTEHAP